MSTIKFFEDKSIKENCKMRFTYTFNEYPHDKLFEPKQSYLTNLFLHFKDVLSLEVCKEVEWFKPNFDKENNRSVNIDMIVFNGLKSKEVIREAILKKAIQ